MKKLLVFLTLFLAPLALSAQNNRSSDITGMRVVGNAVASEFGKWSARVALGANATGSFTMTIDQGTLVVPDGMGIMPFQTNIPIKINDGTLTETVTPSSVNCSFGGAVCQFTATFTQKHPYSFTVTSGTAGLQEAIENMKASPLGGLVLVTPDWQGTTGMLTAATGTTAISLMDTRQGVLNFYSWNGSAYVGSTLGGAWVVTGSITKQATTANDVLLGSASGGDFASGAFPGTLVATNQIILTNGLTVNPSMLFVGYDSVNDAMGLISAPLNSGARKPLELVAQLANGTTTLTLGFGGSNGIYLTVPATYIGLHVAGTTGGGLQITQGITSADLPISVTDSSSNPLFSINGVGTTFITGTGGTGVANGLQVQAGTNSSDYALLIKPKGSSDVALEVRGDESIIMHSLQLTGSATGKKVVCVDTTTGILYASSASNSCLN